MTSTVHGGILNGPHHVSGMVGMQCAGIISHLRASVPQNCTSPKLFFHEPQAQA